MREIFERVRGAVSTKDLVPALTHFAFRKGTVAGFDGRMFIEAKLPKVLHSLNCTVEAGRFMAAIDACQGTPDSMVVENSQLRIIGGPFSALLPVGRVEDFIQSTPDPATHQRREELLPLLRRLHPFIGEDASRSWASGILFDGTMAYATNNVVLARSQLKQGMPGRGPANLPLFAVDELLRIAEEPVAIGRSVNTLTFYYSDKSWLRTVLFEVNWPKAPADLLDPPDKSMAEFWPIAPSLLPAVQSLVPFCPDPKNPVIMFNGDQVQTLDGVHSAVVRGLSGALSHGAYRAEPLIAVLGAASKATWGEHPRVRWVGEQVEGLIVGVLE